MPTCKSPWMTSHADMSRHKGLFEYTKLPFLCGIGTINNSARHGEFTPRTWWCMRVHGRHFDNWSNREGPPEQPGLGPAQTPDCRDEAGKMWCPTSSVSYLAHVISADGLRTADAKVKAVVEAPKPQNVAELRSFLAMVNYYSKVLPNKLSPLYQLLHKSTPWRCGSKQRGAFQHIQRIAALRKCLNTF